ncbi:transcriptional repressor general negative regulator of transcription subunit 4, partial [Modicella reniformis]
MPSNGSSPGQASVGVYITYVRKEDATKAIAAIDGSIWDGRILRASYGTTKYCTYYLRGMSCQNPGCMYLHEPGEDADSFTKEDLAVGKHHQPQDQSSYDPYGNKPNPLGRPPLPHQGTSSSSLTPKAKPATVGSFHTNTSDWPAPGGERSNYDDKDDDGSALPATASWGKVNSNPSTPTLHNSTLRKSDGPPPLRSKGSTASIITGVVVNNGKRKEVNYAKDGSQMDSPVVDAPTPAEALAIESAAKQQVLLEQRQQQEQLRKQLQQQKQQQEAEQQAELLNLKLRKQKQSEQEREQQELQKQKQQQEMEQKMQKQKEKEERKKEQERQEKLQKEKEQQEKTQREQELKEQKEHEEREEKERVEKDRLNKERLEEERLEEERLEEERLKNERLEREQQEKEQLEKEMLERQREAKERKEREEREEQEMREQKERERKVKESRLAQNQPILTLGSFSFNPDPSLATLPHAFGGGDGVVPLGSETAGPFGLDTFAAFSNLPLTPTHYTGSFNPFSMDDEPLMRRSQVPTARSFLNDADYDPTSGRNRPVGPPIPGKPRQTSRFGFAMDNQYSDSFGREGYSDTQSMQDGFRALFPNVNVSFGQPNGSLNQHQQQPQQQSQQVQYHTSPLLHRQEASLNASVWGSGDKQDDIPYQRAMNQLEMDAMLTTPSSRMAEYHQQLSMQQLQQQPLPQQQHQHQHQHQQRSGPPGLVRNPMTPTMIKSPPPGLESLARNDYNGWSISQQAQQQPPPPPPPPPQQQQQQQQQQQLLQQLQQQQQQTSRLNNWASDSAIGDHGVGIRGGQDGAQDFFGAFLKSAVASQTTLGGSAAAPPNLAFQDPAIMSARISSSGNPRNSLVDSLQQPTVGGYSGSFGLVGHDPSSDIGVGNDITNSPLLQQFGLGPKRMD